MGKKLAKSLRKAKKMSDKPIPGGYVTFQLLDAITMATTEIKKDIEATTRVSIEPAEFYRLLARFSMNMTAIDNSVKDLNEILRKR